MKLSLNWIRKYVDLPENLNLDVLAHDLTMRTVEIESAINPALALDKIVVGVIQEILPHPQADKLSVCLVDVGKEAPSTIVCGGSNIEVNMSVAVAIPGATVRWHGEGEPILIKTTKLRGVTSEGMICAASEMNLQDLFPTTDEHAILDLTSFPAKPGTPVAEVLELEDIILEIDNKSLTNRPDLWCHYGIARELAAIYKLPLHSLPEFLLPNNLPKYPVTIKNPDLCHRYTAMQYEGLKNTPSPYWLKLSLWKVGIRPISSLVDITNYVMLAVGQPTHAFDKNMIQKEIVIRTALPNESLMLLDGKNLHLSSEDLAICDAFKPIALGGIMGGEKDSIAIETNSIVLEIANFEPKNIRRSATRHQVRTESSIRNEKGLDTQRVDQAMSVANALIKHLYPSARMTAFADCYPHKTEPVKITVHLDWLEKRLGRSIVFDEVQGLLNPLGIKVSQKEHALLVDVPTWRATGDISIKDDVLEEIARMIGYEHFDFIPPTVQLNTAINQPEISLERKIREYLAHQCEMQEIYTYPWVHSQFLKAAGINKEECLQLSAPPSPDYACLKPSLVPTMLEAVSKNLRYFGEFRIFELSQVFSKGETRPSEEEEILPLQQRFLTAALVGKDGRDLFRKAKGVIELLPRVTMAHPFAFLQEVQPAWADHKTWLNVSSDGMIIGSIGLISLQTAKAADIKHTQVAVFELNVELIKPLPSRSNQYHPLPQFPLVEQDFSVLLDEKISWLDIKQALEKTVLDISFVEEYRGKQVPEGKKSVTFKVMIGSDQGTLTAQQIEEKTNAIKKKLTRLGGELRI